MHHTLNTELIYMKHLPDKVMFFSLKQHLPATESVPLNWSVLLSAIVLKLIYYIASAIK